MDQELIVYLDGRFGEFDRRFGKLDGRFDELEGRFGETSQQIASLRQETAQRFDAVEGAIRQTHVAVEDLRGEVQILAEGVIGIEEKLQSFRGDVSFRLDEVQRSIEPYYKNLDRRVRFLEERVEREGQASLDIIRERYGKKTS